jgi:hypothetical protein
VSALRLTYQIRLLTLLASERNAKLVIRIPKSAGLSPRLRDYVKEHRRVLKIDRVA